VQKNLCSRFYVCDNDYCFADLPINHYVAITKEQARQTYIPFGIFACPLVGLLPKPARRSALRSLPKAAVGGYLAAMPLCKFSRIAEWRLREIFLRCCGCLAFRKRKAKRAKNYCMSDKRSL